ncbi:hypothetical protein DPMN_164711 [Dreissena polymorpha]|uniref:Uncharacterized protein n=1 Tax=Dreissena polymorpha TaxID=45954 RepID=A0A9D4IVP1_DREPO|nr:hypothetical protein DPMN_164711 [Dreissena polymorpha]
MDKDTRVVLKPEINEHKLAGEVDFICEKAPDEPNVATRNVKQCYFDRVEENDDLECVNVKSNSNFNVEERVEQNKTQAKCGLRFGIDAILKVTNLKNNEKNISRCEEMSPESDTNVNSDNDVTDSDFDSDDGIAMMSNNIGIAFNPGYLNLNSKLHDVHFQPMTLNGLTSSMASMTSCTLMPMMTSWAPSFLAEFRKERANGWLLLLY